MSARSDNHRPGPLQIRIPAGNSGALNLAGNPLAAEYISSNSLNLLQGTPPSVLSVAHYPTAAAKAGSGPIDATWESTNLIYSVIQFAGPQLDEQHFFYQLGSAARVRFGPATGVTEAARRLLPFPQHTRRRYRLPVVLVQLRAHPRRQRHV